MANLPASRGVCTALRDHGCGAFVDNGRWDSGGGISFSDGDLLSLAGLLSAVRTKALPFQHRGTSPMETMGNADIWLALHEGSLSPQKTKQTKQDRKGLFSILKIAENEMKEKTVLKATAPRRFLECSILEIKQFIKDPILSFVLAENKGNHDIHSWKMTVFLNYALKSITVYQHLGLFIWAAFSENSFSATKWQVCLFPFYLLEINLYSSIPDSRFRFSVFYW